MCCDPVQALIISTAIQNRENGYTYPSHQIGIRIRVFQVQLAARHLKPGFTGH